MSAPAERIDARPTIRIEGGDLPEQVDQAIAALAIMPPAKRLLVFGDRLACIRVLEQDEAGIIARPAGSATVHYTDATYTTELLTEAARWVRFDRRIGDYRDCDAPMRFAHHILARGAWPEFSRCTGIIEAPTLWRGEIIDRPGLHASSGLYLTARPKGYRPPPVHPTGRDAESALEQLRDSVSTFAFDTEADRTAAIAGIMTVVLRRPMRAAPAIGIDANLPASGKSLLARVMAAIGIGRSGAVIALTGEPNEDEKRLGAALVGGDQVLIADNIEAELNSPLLCTMLTEKEVSVRVLGQSRNVRLPTNVVMILNGNNLPITRDLRRRVLMMRLNAGVERPEERVFSRDAVEYVLERRGSLIRAVLTIAKAYHEMGAPHVGVSPFGGFEDWDLAVRRPLIWLNQPDPLQPSEGLREIDPDIQTTRALFAAWCDTFPDGTTTANALRTARKMNHRFDGEDELTHPELRDAIQMAIGDKLDSRALSRWLRRHRDRIIDGLTLHQGEDLHAKVARWQVRKCGVMRG